MSIVDSVRRPEYTGENRCVPCTVVNAVIAVVLSAGVAAALVAAGDVAVPIAAGAGIALLAVCGAAIYLRGYLVPGTPALTKRYLPDRVLAKFDKLPEDPGSGPGAGGETGEGADLDPEKALASAGALEPCDRGEDLCLTGAFRDDWHDGMAAMEDRGVDTGDILGALSMDDRAETASLTRHGEAVLLTDGGHEMGKWESQAALVADVAAADLLSERHPEWSELNSLDRSRLLRGLRIFLEECPLCGGQVRLGQDTVESCCRSYDVVAVTCEDCEARLFEEQWNEEAAA